MTQQSNQVFNWHSKMLGEGTISYYSDFNIGINATITITKFNVALEKFPRIAVVDFPASLDDNIYELRYANWERDFLTTAVQSPQQGTAPLVGLTTYTETVNDVLADGSGCIVTGNLMEKH